MSPLRRSESAARPRGFALWGVCILIAICALSFAIEILKTEVSEVTTWEVRFDSAPGLPPVEVYWEDERVGRTPLTIPGETYDPRIRRVGKRALDGNEELLEALGLDLTVCSVRARRRGENWISLAMVGRWPDGSLDELIVLLLGNVAGRNDAGKQRIATVFRVRRQGARACAIEFQRSPYETPRSSSFERLLFRRSVTVVTTTITVGRGVPLDQLSHPALGPPEQWVFSRTPFGAEKLALPKEASR